MANGLLSWINRVDGASFTTDSQAATLPASNLADTILGRPWRTSGTTSAYVEIDFGAGFEVGLLMIAGFDISASDTVRHRLSMVSPAGGEVLDTGVVPSNSADGYGIVLHLPPSTLTARYWRIDVNAPSRASAGYFSAGRAWAGPVFQAAKNHAYGFSEQWLDQSTLVTAPRSGVEYVDETVQLRTVTFAYEFLTEAEAKNELREMSRLTGVRNQVVFVPNPNSAWVAQEAIIGRLSQTTPIQHPEYSIFSKTFQIRESK